MSYKVTNIVIHVISAVLILSRTSKCSDFVSSPADGNHRTGSISDSEHVDLSRRIEHRSGKAYSSVPNKRNDLRDNSGDTYWNEDGGVDSQVSSNDLLPSASPDQFPSDSVSYGHGFVSDRTHGYSQVSKGHHHHSPGHHGWSSHGTSPHSSGWNGGWRHEHGWGNVVSYESDTWSDYWTKIKGWFASLSTITAVGALKGLLVLVPVAIAIGLLIYHIHIPLIVACNRSSPTGFWKNTTQLTHKILSSDECIARISCEINHISIFDSLISNYLFSRRSSGKKRGATLKSESKTVDNNCEKFRCDSLSGLKKLFEG